MAQIVTLITEIFATLSSLVCEESILTEHSVTSVDGSMEEGID